MPSDEIQVLTFRDLIAGYRRRADVLRQIHGRKASLGRKQEAVYLIVTVLLATVLTVIGFAGGARIASIIPSDWLAPAKATGFVETVMNVLVLVVLILTLIGLIYRYGERANLHFRSVEILTEFIRDLDDSIALHDSDVRLFKDTDVDIVRTRYKGLLGALPPNTDREYLKARDHARKKREKVRRGASVHSRAGVVLVPTGGSLLDLARARKIGQVLSKDSARMVVLSVVSDVLPSEGWVVGGFVREAVWDDLEGAALSAPVGEVDVVYYDAADTSRAAEAALRSQLSTKARNIEWSVKNQARMHEVNGHEPYGGVEDAIKRAPETASSVAVRLSAKRIYILAPLGLKDLVKGILRPNPNASIEAFEGRLGRLYKTDRWPNLKLERPASKETAGQD